MRSVRVDEGVGAVSTQTSTILVTDLVGSTELRVRLGEDDADALRRVHDDLLAASVAEQAGTLVKGLGDGVLAMFASSADAVAAAVAVQQAAHAHGRRHPDQALAIRVGISVGDVSVEDGDCFGTPVIEAARLCDAADGGQVLAADLVEALARGRGGHEYRPVGELELKGLPDPVRTVEVVWVPATAGPGAGAAPPFPPLLHDERSVWFVGRPDAVEQLSTLWKQALGGQRRCALLAGEPGIGKTRLASEIARRAHDEGATVLLGRCEEELGLPFQPFVEALAYQVAATGPSADDLGRFPADLARLYPELADLVPGLGEPAHGDPDVERHRMFEATTSWLAAAAEPAGLVLVLDDLHWAGKPTLLLLRHLLRSPDAARILVIGTYRDTDLDRTHPLGELLADLRREPGVERLALAGLTGEEVEAFLVAASGEELDDDKRALAAAVHAETEGNAFFVGEVLRHLAESGAIVQRDGRWQAAVALEDMAIPEGVREVIGRRVSRLSDPVNDVLRWAAVVGRDVEFGVLADVVDGSEDDLLGALDEAVDARLVDEVGADRYRFVHALVRSTLLDEIRTTRRVRMHLRIAESLERRRPDDLAALAFHYGEAATAGAGDRAVEYAGRAAAQAFARTAYDEAVARYEQALELLDDLAPDDGADEEQVRRLDLLLGLGRAAFARGGGGHEQPLADAFTVARALGDGERMAEALLAGHRGWGSVAFAANAALVADIEATLSLLPTGDSVPRARLLTMLATEVSSDVGDRRGRALQDEAVAMARRVGDDGALLEALGGQWATLLGHRDRAAWEAIFDECFAVLGRTGDVGQEVSWLLARRDMLLGIGAPTEADEVFEQVLRFDPAVLPAVTRWMIANAVAGERLYRGAHDEAEPLVERAFLLGQESGALDAFVYYGNHLLFLRHQQGRSEEVIELVADWLATDPPGRIYWDAALAMLLAGCDRFAEARALYEDCVGAFPGHRFDLSYLPFGACLAHLAADLDEPDRAPELLTGLAPYRGELAGWRSLSTLGPVDLATGRLLTLLDRPDEALEHLAASAGTCERGRLAPFLAMTRLAQGDASHALGDDEAARGWWTEALALATAGDYRTTMRRASAALACLPEVS